MAVQAELLHDVHHEKRHTQNDGGLSNTTHLVRSLMVHCLCKPSEMSVVSSTGAPRTQLHSC